VTQQINLFNPVFLTRKPQFSAAAMVQALAVLVVGSLAIYAFEARQNRTAERTLADADNQVSARRDQLLNFSKQFSQQGASKALIADLELAEARLQARRALLEDVRTGVGGDVHGYSRYLGALARQVVQGVWLTGVQIGGKSNELVIKGRALDSSLVPLYMRALNREEPFAGRRVGELRLTAVTEPPATPGVAPREPSRYIEFSLSIPLRGDS